MPSAALRARVPAASSPPPRVKGSLRSAPRAALASLPLGAALDPGPLEGRFDAAKRHLQAGAAALRARAIPGSAVLGTCGAPGAETASEARGPRGVRRRLRLPYRRSGADGRTCAPARGRPPTHGRPDESLSRRSSSRGSGVSLGPRPQGAAFLGSQGPRPACLLPAGGAMPLVPMGTFAATVSGRAIAPGFQAQESSQDSATRVGGWETDLVGDRPAIVSDELVR